MNFIKTLTAILTDAPDIKELPMAKLISLDGGEEVKVTLSQASIIKIARLQTLKCIEDVRTATPEPSEKLTGLLYTLNLGMQASVLEAREDSRLRFAMLDRLITEIVRDCAPPESELVDYRYTVGQGDQGPRLYRKKLDADPGSNW